MPHARRTSRTPATGLLLLLLATLAPLLLSAAPAQADPTANERAPARPRAATATGTEPLTVTMTSLSPASIPATGTISISGTVTNTSEEDWSDVNMAPFVSSTPITTRDDLALAAATEADATVGSRLTEPSTLEAVGDLRPGQSTTFDLRIPVDLLGISGDPGVYWIGVHALGANAEGRDQVADGRARTFIPLLPTGRLRGEPTPVTIVLSLRDRVRRDAQGRVNGPSRWTDLTSARGRLTNLVDLAASAGTAPFSWVVDPAVLDALDDLAQGNPRLSLGGAQKRPTDEPSQSAGESPSASPSSTPTASPGTRTDDATGSVDQATRDASARVLATFLGTAQGSDLHTTGYADPDVVALARQRPGLLSRADALATRRLAARGLEAGRVVAPPDGYFDGQEVSSLPRDTTLLLSDQGRERTTPTATRLPTGQDVVLTDARASSGGPSPMRRFDTLAVRQRVLSEAALEQMDPSLDGQPRPMVVQLPPRWDPGPSWRDADLFGTLTAAPWVRLTALPRDASTTYDGRLAYGRTQRAQELGPANIDATRALGRTATVLGQLLDNDNDVSDTLTGAALSASSYFARDDRSNAAALVRDLDGTTRGRLDQVAVTVGDPFATMSGGSGALTVTIVNGLKQPITVGLRATSDPGVRIKVPDPVELGAGQRYTTRLPVTSRSGVHEVSLQPVTADGLDAGTPTTFSLRSSQVGKLIWYIMAGGGLLLAVMIAKRITQRLRHHQWRRDDGAAA